MLGVQVVLTPAVGFEMVTVMVVLEEQLAAIPPDDLAGCDVGATTAGVDLPSATELGTASLVEGATLSRGAAPVDLAGALEMVGAALLDGGAWLGSTALLDSTGFETIAVVGLLAGVELDFGAAVVVGFGSAAPILTGTMFCFNDNSA